MTASTTLPGRLSPLHGELDHYHPVWGQVGGMPVALSFAKPQAEVEAAAKLGICDASALARITLKGPGAKGLLDSLNIAVPDAIFGVTTLGQHGVAARTGGSEFFVEDGPTDGAVAEIEAALVDSREVYPVRRADAVIMLSGSQALDVLEQTCGYNFRGQENKLVFTRVAGVSCSILPRVLNGIPLFQLWMDGTFGVYLWETLNVIAGEQGGGPVGLACFFPNLS